MSLTTWFKETRPQFLPLSLVLVPLGTSVAIYDSGIFNVLNFIVALFGLVLLHVSVNVLNDYFDYKSGLDLMTIATPFSGGSKILPAGMLNPQAVYRFGLACFSIGALIGIYFMVTVGLLLLPVIVLGAIAVCFYTTKLAKLMLGEIFAGLGLGALPILGAYFVQAGSYSIHSLAVSAVPGILTFNLLFLNEFPDVEVDRKVGRRNFVIVLGKAKAAKLYSALTIAAFAWIALCTLLRVMPLTSVVALIALPLAVKAVKVVLHNYDKKVPALIPALGANVMVALTTPALLSLGFTMAYHLRL